jgi:orotidine-5'-phosphate decarboxylase
MSLAVSFLDRLRASVSDTGSVLCVGLDPRPAPPGDLASFCLAITEATAPYAAAFKPNLAFFEAHGAAGWTALERVCQGVRDSGRLLILDAKRGDIGSTAEHYATALFDHLGGDAATVAPYMGADSITPFLGHAGRCAIVLAATSNPGASDLQALPVDAEPLYRHVARMAVAAGEGQPGTVGLVVGGTRPAILGDLRAEFPGVPFLVPGVGAQGGSPGEILRANAGGPVLVNASRSILYASTGADFARAAADAAARLAEELAG